MDGPVEPTVAVTVRAALMAWRPLRWAFDALGIGKRPARGSAKDSAFWREFASRFHLTFEQDADRRPKVRGAIEGIAFSVKPNGAGSARKFASFSM